MNFSELFADWDTEISPIILIAWVVVIIFVPLPHHFLLSDKVGLLLLLSLVRRGVEVTAVVDNLGLTGILSFEMLTQPLINILTWASLHSNISVVNSSVLPSSANPMIWAVVCWFLMQRTEGITRIFRRSHRKGHFSASILQNFVSRCFLARRLKCLSNILHRKVSSL